MKKIKLSKGRFALVDDEDYETVSPFKWCLFEKNKKKYYAFGKVNGKRIMMHRLILNAPPDMIVDHKDNDGLDNRRCNIRLCNPTENCMNRSKTTKKKHSKYKGVYLEKSYKKPQWRAGIRINNKTIHLGCHKTEKEAAIAYNVAANKMFGEFAHLNAV